MWYGVGLLITRFTHKALAILALQRRSTHRHHIYIALYSKLKTQSSLPFSKWTLFIICPIAISHSTEQIIKPVCVRHPVCAHSHNRISWSIFTKIDTDVRAPKSKKRVRWGQYRTTSSPILPHKTPILGQEVLKIHANINNPISAFNVR